MEEQKLNELKLKIKEYCLKNGLEIGDLKFKNQEDMNEYLGSSYTESIGGMIFEGSDLYTIMNFLDVAGDFSFAIKHQNGLNKIFEDLGLYFELYDNVSATILKH